MAKKVPNSILPQTTTGSHTGWLLVVVIVLIGTFHVATLRSGHAWGGDFAQYILHARNIAEGRPYMDTGIVYNPHNIVLGPQAYPPGYPTILAPFYAGFGNHVKVFKLVQIGMLCGTLFLIPMLFSELSRKQTFLLVILAGMNPMTWISRDEILSEHLFVFLWLLTTLWVTRCSQRDFRLRDGLVAAVLVFWTCQTRTVGIIFLPSLIIVDALRSRRMTLFSAVTIGVMVLLTVAQKAVMPATGAGYLEQLNRISVTSLSGNISENLSALSQIFDNGYFGQLRVVIALLSLPVGCVGFVIHNRPKVQFVGIASLLYLALVTIWPTAAGPRMILPLVPAFLFFVMIGFQACAKKVSMTVISPVLAGALLISFVGHYYSSDYSMIEGPHGSQAQELFQAVKQTSSTEDVFMFFKPRALTLYAGRPAAVFPESDSGCSWQEWAQEIDADFVIVRTEESTRNLAFMNESPDPQPGGTPIFQNRDFMMYRLKP